MTTTTLRRWGRSLGLVVPHDEVVLKGLREGQRVQVLLEPLPGPDDFADICGRVRWRKTAQQYKDELRRMWGE